MDELVAKYDVSQNPEVITGKKTAKEAIREFANQWDRLNNDGVVTFEEFEDYYKEVSASVDGDDYFELMIRNAWRIAGGEGMAANTANKRVLVTHKDGTQRVVGINNELGMKAGDKAAIRSRLAGQGVEAMDVELHGGVDTTEKAKGHYEVFINLYNLFIIYIYFYFHLQFLILHFTVNHFPKLSQYVKPHGANRLKIKIAKTIKVVYLIQMPSIHQKL